MEVVHHGDIEHQEADALSSLVTNGEETSPLKHDIPLLTIVAHTHEDKSKNGDIVVSLQSFLPRTSTEFLRTQASSAYCGMGNAQAGQKSSELSVNPDGLLIRHSCIDGALQIIIPPWLLQRIFVL